MCECGATRIKARGKCGKCYRRFLRAQPESLRDRRTPVERFWSKVDKTQTCWLWTGTATPKGYGQFAPHRVHVYAHRYAYELMVGPIPEGLTIDHVAERGCRSRRCVNPAHLEVVTRGENTRRADNKRTCAYCSLVITAQNMGRHVAARHLGEPS